MKLPATATLDETGALARRIEAEVAAESGPLRVDAGELSAFDTSALALLLHAQRLAKQAGRGFELHGAPPQLAQLASLYGVASLLGLESAAES